METELNNTNHQAELAYEIIKGKTLANCAMQTASGVLGGGSALAADLIAVAAFYVPMWNEIRAVYGCGTIGMAEIMTVLKSAGPYLAADLVMDKVFGPIPVLGMPINYFCAKVMTWRLGTLFTFFASRGEGVNPNLAAWASQFMIDVFPRGAFSFTKVPSRQHFVDFVSNASGDSDYDCEVRIARAMETYKTRQGVTRKCE